MSRIRIAVCDDHPVFRAGLSSMLAAQPTISVLVEAGTTAELKRKLQDTRVDLILLDAQLPEESGLEALPALVREARVLVFSAFDDPERVKRAMQLGAVGYVRKDVSPAELLRCLSEAAAGRTVLDTDLASRVAKSLRRAPDEASFERRVEALTPRQREVLELLRQGKSAKEIAEKLFVSEGTAKNHVTRILQLLEVTDRAKLVHLLAQYRIST
jgi:DNA-binding NarL/FixJ family response regulator